MKPNQVNTKSLSILEAGPLAPIDTTLNRIFPSTKEESLLLKARSIMGECISDLPEEVLEVYITEFQYLIDYWLDGYEVQVFDGQTLKQLLGQA